MKKLAIALAATFVMAQAAPVLAAKHEKACKSGEKMDEKSKKCVKAK